MLEVLCTHVNWINDPVFIDTEDINLGRFVSDLRSYGGACQNNLTMTCNFVNKHQLV